MTNQAHGTATNASDRQREPVTDQTITSTHHGVVRGHVVTAVGVLRNRLAEPWTLDLLAEEVHLSRSQVVRAFDVTVGTSPMAYLRKMRVERMAHLLATTDLSIAEAARAVGWTNQFHASQILHVAFGVSPTEYRRRQAVPPIG
jgi:transcriptional regulator GlxA family with amidase domain